MMDWIYAAIGAAAGGAAGVAIGLLLAKARARHAGRDAERMLEESRREVERLRREAEVAAKEEALAIRQKAEKEAQKMQKELRDEQKRLRRREDVVEQKVAVLNRKERTLEKREAELREIRRRNEEKEKELSAALERQNEELRRISGLSKEQAKEILIERISKEMEREKALLVAREIEKAQEQAEDEARKVLSVAIQRVAVEHTQESVVSTVDLPNEEMKGRIIGREGRNIRAFEKITGVDLIVDDTPGVVVVSSFDSLRREVARRALEKLVADGRIHPARIEEVVENTKKQINEQVQRVGRDACMEADVHSLHPRLVALLGRMHLRTSYGQNVLKHSMEVAHLCGTLAGELGADVKLAKRCGLLHDIGKAVDQEIEGAHPEIGADLAKRYNEKATVVNAIAAHHGDAPAASIYAVIVQVADAISAARPGARRETLEKYVKRLEKLEEVASSFDGVRNAYAIQAGREVRVIIDPEKISDEESLVLARSVAGRVAKELTFAGEIKVTVIRETRAVEYAR